MEGEGRIMLAREPTLESQGKQNGDSPKLILLYSSSNEHWPLTHWFGPDRAAARRPAGVVGIWAMLFGVAWEYHFLYLLVVWGPLESTSWRLRPRFLSQSLRTKCATGAPEGSVRVLTTQRRLTDMNPASPAHSSEAWNKFIQHRSKLKLKMMKVQVIAATRKGHRHSSSTAPL